MKVLRDISVYVPSRSPIPETVTLVQVAVVKFKSRTTPREQKLMPLFLLFERKLALVSKKTE